MKNYVHEIPGRLRVRSGAIRNNPANAAAAEALLRGIPGVSSAATSTLTGSVTVHYDPCSNRSSELMQALREKGLLTALPHPPARRISMSPQNRALASQIAGKVATHALETVVERSVVALIAALL